MKDFLRIYGKAIWIFLKKTPKFLGRMIAVYVVILLVLYLLVIVPFGGSVDLIMLVSWILLAFTGIVFFWYLTIDSIVVAFRCLKLMKKFEITVSEIIEAVFKYDLLNPEYKNVRNGSKYSFDLWLDDAEFTYGFKKITIKYSRRR